MEKFKLLTESTELIEAIALVMGDAKETIDFPTKLKMVQNILLAKDMIED